MQSMHSNVILFGALLRHGGNEKQMVDVCYTVVKYIVSKDDSVEVD